MMDIDFLVELSILAFNVWLLFALIDAAKGMFK